MTRPNNAAMYFGQQALDKFAVCLNSLFQSDATGNAYGVTRAETMDLRMVRFTGCRVDGLAYELAQGETLDQYEWLVIDSGNSHGDSWVATFYPRQCVMTFVNQVPSLDEVSCMSCGGSPDAGFRGGQCSACAGHSEDNASAPSVVMTEAADIGDCPECGRSGSISSQKHLACFTAIMAKANGLCKCGQPATTTRSWQPVCARCADHVDHLDMLCEVDL